MGVGAVALVARAYGLDFRIRTMGSPDLDGVMAIEEVSFPTPWTRGMFVEDLERDFSAPIVAVSGTGEIVGYAVCWSVAGESHLLNIAVHPASRRRGIGRALVGECIARSARAGSSLLYLEVRVGNEEAQRLYGSMGFRLVGIRKRYYTDTGEDAALLAREIRESDAVSATAVRPREDPP